MSDCDPSNCKKLGFKCFHNLYQATNNEFEFDFKSLLTINMSKDVILLLKFH